MWIQRLRGVYKSKKSWLYYSEMYGLAERLGYVDPKQAWIDNPWIQGSVDPKDYKVVVNYRQGSKQARTAWFVYNKSNPDKKSCVDFLAGWNAAVQQDPEIARLFAMDTGERIELFRQMRKFGLLGNK